MKKNLLFLVGMGLITSLPLSAQTFTVRNLNFPVQHADITSLDVDGDGDLDILVSGEDAGARKLQLFLNSGVGTFTAAPSPFTPVTRTTFDFDDINGDGKFDMIESGFPAAGIFAGIYTSNGAGAFTASSITLPQLAPSSGFADLNNDGYQDIYVFGNKGDGKPKILFNNKIGGFTESAQFDAYNFVDPEVSEIDYDKDGDIDLFVNAGYEDGVATRFSKMFINNNGTFTAQALGITPPKGNGSAVWADYDGDGYPDLLLNGDGYIGSGEDNDGVYRLFHNNAGAGFTGVTTFQNYRQNSTGDGGRFTDWDNDGDLDIVVTGWNGSRQATDIFLNTAGVFTANPTNEQIPGVSESSIEVADIDGDTDLDILVTGYSGNAFNGTGSAYNSNVSLIIVNPGTVINVRPASPTNLNVTGNSTSVNFTWNAGTDLTTPANSLSYNLFLVNTSTGQHMYFPLADTSTGKLIVQRLGNVQLNKSWTVKGLPAGNYRWGVQAIDNSFMGSTFATANFTVNANGTLPVVLSSFNAVAEANKARIEWTTSSEQNNDRFEIERSSNGRNFYKLSTVKGKGTTSASNNYSIYDNNPSNGVNYYRLIQYNLDGRSTDHGVKAANFRLTPIASVTAFPNPAKSDLAIRLRNFTGKNLTIMLSDVLGRLVHKEIIETENGQGEYKLNLKSKPLAGEYIMLVSGEGLKETIKVVIR
jgi:hypothetical protein